MSKKNKRKGFTIIELLAILIILGIIFTIAYPLLSGYLENASGRYYKTLENSLELAGVDFSSDNPSFLPKTVGGIKKITIDQIIKYGEMEKVTDKDGKPCEEGFVVIERVGPGANDYEYTVCLTCGEYKTNYPICEREDTRFLVDYILRHENVNGPSYIEGTWSSTNIYQEFSNNMLYGERIDTYQRKLDNGVWENFSGNNFILEESRDVEVRAIDISGNISDVVGYKVLIDKNPITITSKASIVDFVYQSEDYKNKTIADLFIFGPFGPSGGNITCKVGDTVVYKNNNKDVEVNKKISEFNLARSTSVACSSETGAGLKREGHTTFTITAKSIAFLNPNGGSVTPTSVEIIYGEKYPNLPFATRTGYNFDGWFTSITGGNNITSNLIVNVTTNQTLYAHWAPKKFIVTFYPNGGTTSVSSKEVTYDNKYGSLPVPVRPGYKFEGWFTKDGKEIHEDDIVNILENIEVTAKWRANKYLVTFNPNGGSVNPTSKNVTYDENYGELPVPRRDGYDFNGWFTDINGGTEIISSTTVKITANQTLYAHWTSNTFTVTFDANGGSVSQTSKTITFGKEYGTLPTPTRSGYVFTGWYTTTIGTEEKTKTSLVTTNSNHTLYAHWLSATCVPVKDTWGNTSEYSSIKITADGQNFREIFYKKDTDSNYSQTFTNPYVYANTNHFKFNYYTQDSLNNNTAANWCYSKFDNLKPYTARLDDITFNVGSNIASVDYSCDKDTTEFHTTDVNCVANVTRINTNEKISKFSTKTTYKDQPSTSYSGISFIAKITMTRIYDDGSPSCQHVNEKVNGQWVGWTNVGVCDDLSRQKVTYVIEDVAGNKSSTLTIDYNW